MPKTVRIIVVGTAKSARIFLQPLTTFPTQHIDLLWFLAVACKFKRSKSVTLSLVLSLHLSVLLWCLTHTHGISREPSMPSPESPVGSEFKPGAWIGTDWSLEMGLK